MQPGQAMRLLLEDPGLPDRLSSRTGGFEVTTADSGPGCSRQRSGDAVPRGAQGVRAVRQVVTRWGRYEAEEIKKSK